MGLKILFVFVLVLSNLVLCIAQNRFERICGNGAQMTLLRSLFRVVITPIYGNQEEALKKISDSNDREAYFLVNEEKVLGVVVYKKNLTQEFAVLGINNAIELKTLFIIDSEKNSGVGLGTQLLNKCLEYARSVEAKYIVVTASEKKFGVIRFFEKKGFSKIHVIPNKYKIGIAEYILAKSLSYLY